MNQSLPISNKGRLILNVPYVRNLLYFVNVSNTHFNGRLAISAGPIPGLQLPAGLVLIPELLFPTELNPLKVLFIDEFDEEWPRDDAFVVFVLVDEELFGENFAWLNGEVSRRFNGGGIWSIFFFTFLPMSGPFCLITLALRKNKISAFKAYCACLMTVFFRIQSYVTSLQTQKEICTNKGTNNVYMRQKKYKQYKKHCWKNSMHIIT